MAPTGQEGGARAALLRASQPPGRELFAALITANHILHHHGVVDGYGHISMRNPQDPSTFFMSRSSAPALVRSRADIEEYRVSDASAVREGASRGYVERFIHSELYKRYPGVASVVHAHAEAVLPFGLGSTPLRPVFHMGGVMGAQVPVYDIAQHYRSSDAVHSLLVDNEHLGAALAAGFHPSSTLSRAGSMLRGFVTSSPAAAVEYPACPTVLMRGHGFTCVGTSIREVVFRAVYTCVNARVQTTALLMQGTYNIGLVGERFGGGDKATGPAKYEDIVYLSDKECKDAGEKNLATVERPWELWSVEVAGLSLYKNELATPPY